MTKFLVDENIPSAIAHFLRNKGFGVKEVKEAGIHGISDAEIMDLARREDRVLLTFDKHFSNILLYPLHYHNGMIRIRVHLPLLSDIIQALDLSCRSLISRPSEERLLFWREKAFEYVEFHDENYPAQ